MINNHGVNKMKEKKLKNSSLPDTDKWLQKREIINTSKMPPYDKG